MSYQTGDGIGGLYVLCFVAADQAGRFHISVVADDGHDVIGVFAPARAIGEGQHSLDDLGVGVIIGGGEDNDRLRGLGVSDIEVVEVEGAAGPADYAHFAGVAHFGAHLVFHLDLVLVGQDHHARLGFAFIGDFELAEDSEYLV